jgi:hypothetical protein
MLGNPQMMENVEGTAALEGPVTLAQGEDSTQGQAVGYMRGQVEVCTLDRAAVSMLVQAAECMQALEEDSTLGQEADFILARLTMVATKARGGLASPEL